MDLDTDYYLLLIDIIDSTKQLQAADFNNKLDLLEKLLTEINKKYKKNIVLPVNISYGDEIAGLFSAPENIYDVVIKIRRALQPHTNIRFVVVKGKVARISTDIRKIGGMIFKKASEAVELLKKNDRFCSWHFENDLTNRTLDSLCEISNVIVQDMSEYQLNVFDLLRKGLMQKQIAVELKKHTQSISDVIQRSKANHVLEAEQTINLILKEYV
jgi:hypothetical protein